MDNQTAFSESVILLLTLSLTLRVSFSKLSLYLLVRFVVYLPCLKNIGDVILTLRPLVVTFICSVVLHVEVILVSFSTNISHGDGIELVVKVVL